MRTKKVSGGGSAGPIGSSPHVHEIPRAIPALESLLPRIGLPPSNLPPRQGQFVGRQTELAKLEDALVAGNHIVAIEGIGGVGKTALALEVAYKLYTQTGRHSHDERDRADEVQRNAAFDAFVWLSAKDRALSDDLIADTIGRTMAVAFVSRIPTEQKVAAVNDLLRAGKCLVVVDNFDTLDPVRDAQAIGFVLNLPEPTKVLITSRKKLDIDALSLDLRSMRVTDSLEMIRSVARQKGLDQIATAEPKILMNIHSATGGLPMAIKWVLGQMKQKGQSLEIVLGYIGVARGDIFDEIFKHSWGLLEKDATSVLKTMPLVVDLVSRECIAAITLVDGYRLDAALGQLVEMSLIDAVDGRKPGERRYGIHALTKTFALQHLGKDPQHEGECRERVARYFLDHVTRHSNWSDLAGLEQINEELANILKQMDWCAGCKRDAMLVAFHRGMYNYFWTKGYWNDDLQYGTLAAGSAVRIGDLQSQAWILLESLGWICFCQGNLLHALEYYRESERIFGQTNDRRGQARACNYIGRLHAASGKLDEARTVLESAAWPWLRMT